MMRNQYRVTDRLGSCGWCGEPTPVVEVWSEDAQEWVQEMDDDEQVCDCDECRIEAMS